MSLALLLAPPSPDKATHVPARRRISWY